MREEERGRLIQHLLFVVQIEEHLMFAESKLEEKNHENEMLNYDLNEARRSK